jgi:hypothetical protein
MVVAAFMTDVLSKVASNDLKSYIYQQLAARFNLHLQGED